mmetsp:Transcript_74243/g.240119  ORF Transcript_74243/g.240119 Transcript_74243/m.240119 type:complete len:219 (-) Transcript_74243:543-1199(-)
MPMKLCKGRTGRSSKRDKALAALFTLAAGSAAMSYEALRAARSTAFPHSLMRQFSGIGMIPAKVTFPKSEPRTSFATNSQPPCPGMQMMTAPSFRCGFKPVSTCFMAKEGRAAMITSASGTTSAAFFEIFRGFPLYDFKLAGSWRSSTRKPSLSSTPFCKRSASSRKSAKTVTSKPWLAKYGMKTWAALPAPQTQTWGFGAAASTFRMCTASSTKRFE